MIYSNFYLLLSLLNTDEHFIHIDDHMFTAYDIHGTCTLVRHDHKYYIHLNIHDIYLYYYTRVAREEARESFKRSPCLKPISKGVGVTTRDSSTTVSRKVGIVAKR